MEIEKGFDEYRNTLRHYFAMNQNFMSIEERNRIYYKLCGMESILIAQGFGIEIAQVQREVDSLTP